MFIDYSSCKNILACSAQFLCWVMDSNWHLHELTIILGIRGCLIGLSLWILKHHKCYSIISISGWENKFKSLSNFFCCDAASKWWKWYINPADVFIAYRAHQVPFFSYFRKKMHLLHCKLFDSGSNICILGPLLFLMQSKWLLYHLLVEACSKEMRHNSRYWQIPYQNSSVWFLALFWLQFLLNALCRREQAMAQVGRSLTPLGEIWFDWLILDQLNTSFAGIWRVSR